MSADEIKYFVLVLAVAVVALTVMAIAYWYIMREDATALTVVSSTVGALVGYLFKLLRDRITRTG